MRLNINFKLFWVERHRCDLVEMRWLGYALEAPSVCAGWGCSPRSGKNRGMRATESMRCPGESEDNI